MGRDSAKELRAIAPLIVTGGPTPTVVGPCTLVTNGIKVIGFSSAQMLRDAPEPLALALMLDGSVTVPVATWSMTRSPYLGIIDLGPLTSLFPPGNKLDVQPLAMSAVSATVDNRGAPSALVSVELTEQGLARRVIPVHVDTVDGNDMSDEIQRLASPDEAFDIDAAVEGASLFAWMPADPVLGRPSEVVVVGFASAYRDRTHKPRDLPPIAELHGLEDLGRALPWQGVGQPAASNELGEVVGEIKDEPSASIDIDLEDE